MFPLVNGTIPHEILAQHGASEVLLRPAAPGTGVVAGGAVRIMLEAAGLSDVLAKSIGSNNPVNNAWATMNALRSLRSVEDVARLRGKTVAEVWRGGAVLRADGSPVVPAVVAAMNAAGGNGFPITRLQWRAQQMSHLKITLHRSPIGFEKSQGLTARALV